MKTKLRQMGAEIKNIKITLNKKELKNIVKNFQELDSEVFKLLNEDMIKLYHTLEKLTNE